MGNRNGKINTNIPIDVIIKRIDECILPDEKEVVLDFLEILEAKMEIKKNLLANCKAVSLYSGKLCGIVGYCHRLLSLYSPVTRS
jgi:septum formation inhibitor-activating ATPase MinD